MMSERHRTVDVESDVGSFADLLLPQPLVDAINAAGFTKPSPVQHKAIPVGRVGTDLLVQAKSGTGKTVVFAVVVLDKLQRENGSPQALILAPTREIAIQTAEVITKIGSFLPEPQPKVGVFVGGLPIIEDEKRLRRSCNIVVGTPGRISALLQSGALVTDAIKTFVLDEADSLLAEAFYPDVTWIYDQLPRRKQVMAFSATYSSEMIADLLPLMKRYQAVRMCDDSEGGVGLLGVRQFYVLTESGPGESLLHTKVSKLLGLLSTVSFHQAVVFCNNKPNAEWLADKLSSAGYPAAYLSGDRAQTERMEAMEAVRGFKLRVMVSTDVMARGVDLDRVNLVVNLDVPRDAATYVHRVGRTGRFGTHGIAVSYVTLQELEMLQTYLSDISGGDVQPLPAVIPDEYYLYNLQTDWERAAFHELLDAPKKSPPTTPPPPAAGLGKAAAGLALAVAGSDTTTGGTDTDAGANDGGGTAAQVVPPPTGSSSSTYMDPQKMEFLPIGYSPVGAYAPVGEFVPVGGYGPVAVGPTGGRAPVGGNTQGVVGWLTMDSAAQKRQQQQQQQQEQVAPPAVGYPRRVQWGSECVHSVVAAPPAGPAAATDAPGRGRAPNLQLPRTDLQVLGSPSPAYLSSPRGGPQRFHPELQLMPPAPLQIAGTQLEQYQQLLLLQQQQQQQQQEPVDAARALQQRAAPPYPQPITHVHDGPARAGSFRFVTRALPMEDMQGDQSADIGFDRAAAGVEDESGMMIPLNSSFVDNVEKHFQAMGVDIGTGLESPNVTPPPHRAAAATATAADGAAAAGGTAADATVTGRPVLLTQHNAPNEGGQPTAAHVYPAGYPVSAQHAAMRSRTLPTGGTTGMPPPPPMHAAGAQQYGMGWASQQQQASYGGAAAAAGMYVRAAAPLPLPQPPAAHSQCAFCQAQKWAEDYQSWLVNYHAWYEEFCRWHQQAHAAQ